MAEGKHGFRRFRLVRSEDVHGQSGTGVVAWGIQYPDGRGSVHWKTRVFPDGRVVVGNTASWDSIEDLEYIHGHEGRTIVEWLDD